MQMLLVGLSVVAAFVLMGVSAHLNYGFMAAFGHTAEAAIMLGAAAVAGDILKACLPFFLVLAWRARRGLFLALGLPAWALLSAVSLIAALGYAAEIRDQTAHARQSLNQALERVVAEEVQLVRLIEGTGEQRAPAVIEAGLAALRQDARWLSSVRCMDATARASRAYCARVFELGGALEAARERVQREQRLTDIRHEIVRLSGAGGGRQSEPQVHILSKILGQSEPRVRAALIVLAALFIEIGSGLGLYLALHHSTPRTTAITSNPEGPPPERVSADAAVPTAPIAAAAQDRLALMEAYWVARIVPAPGARLTLETAWGDYEIWCRAVATQRLSRAHFDTAFRTLAGELGLQRTAAGVSGLALAPGRLPKQTLPRASGAQERLALSAMGASAAQRVLSKAI